MTVSTSLADMAVSAFKSGKAGIMRATALEIMARYPFSEAAVPALNLAYRLHARGSVGSALDIVGKVGFMPVNSQPLTPEIMQGMINVFNRGARLNHSRTINAAGIFILSGGQEQFPALAAPVTQTLMEKAEHFLNQGDYTNAVLAATTAKVGNYGNKVSDLSTLLHDISDKAYAAGDYDNSAAAAYYMVDWNSSREARAEAATLVINAVSKYQPDLKYTKGCRPQSKLVWGVATLQNADDLIRDLPELRMEAAQTMLALQERARNNHHYAAARSIGSMIDQTADLLLHGHKPTRIPALPKKMHSQAKQIAAQSAELTKQLGRRGIPQPRNGVTTGGAKMA